MSIDLNTIQPTDPAWPKRPDGTPMPKGAAEAYLRGQGQQVASSGGGGGRRSKSDGPGDEYVEVKDRIQWFYATYDTGAIVTEKVKVLTVREVVGKSDDAFEVEASYVMVQAAAFRNPEDTHPGRGTSWMRVPGTTPYTRGSEVENAETSAWGRAIAAIGGLVDRGIASAQEIRSKEGGPLEPPSRTNAEALRAAASTAATESVSMPEGGAPAAAEPAPVEESPSASTETTEEVSPSPESPEGVQAADPAPGAAPDVTETVEAETAVEAAERIFKDDIVPPSEQAEQAAAEGLSYDEFKRLARERFIANPLIAATARNMVEQGKLPQVGAVKELTDQQRLLLLDECLKQSTEATK